MRKKKYNNYKPWLFAICVCIVVHFIIFMSFSTAEISTRQHKSDYAKIIMLPLYSTKQSQTDKKLIEWMRAEDPSLIVEPDENYGYSRILFNPKTIFYKPVPINLTSLFLSQNIFPVAFRITLIPFKSDSMRDLFMRVITFKTPPAPNNPIPVNRQKIKNNYQYPYVFNIYTGQTIQTSFLHSDTIKQLIKKYNPQSSTIIELTYPSSDKLLPYGKIISSSGSEELDKRALNNIILDNLPGQIDKSLSGKTIDISIEWQNNYSENKYTRGD